MKCSNQKNNKVLKMYAKNQNDYTNNRIGLNEGLAKKQGLTQTEFDRIQDLHDIKRDIILIIDSINDANEIKKYVQYLKKLEGIIQLAWKFEYNENYHYFTFLPLKCTCPIMDNMDRFGVKQKIYTVGCPIHN